MKIYERMLKMIAHVAVAGEKDMDLFVITIFKNVQQLDR